MNNEERQQDGQEKSADGDDEEAKVELCDQAESPSKEKKGYRDRNHHDYRGKNRNFNRQNESRGNYRYGRFNRPTYNESRGNYRQYNDSRGNYNRYYNDTRENFSRYNDSQGSYNKHNDSRGNYNRNKYDKYSTQKYDHNRRRYQRDNEDSNEGLQGAENVLPPSDVNQGEDFNDSSSLCDASDAVEQQANEVRNKPDYNPSPKYNRGYRRGNNYSYNSHYDDRRSDKSLCDTSDAVEQQTSEVRNKADYNSSKYNRGYRRGNNYSYNSRYDDRRSDKSSFPEDQNSHISTKLDNADSEDKDTSIPEDLDQRNKQTTDYGARKPSYRSDNFRQNFDYNTRERYSDRNSQRGGRRGFGRRGNYSHDSSNYQGKNRYRDSDRDQYYAERDRNFRERETPRDNRYKGNDSQEGYRPKNSRGFARNSYPKHTAELFCKSSKDETEESVDVSSRSQSSDSNQHSIESENQDNADSPGREQISADRNKAQIVKEISDFDKMCSSNLTQKSQDTIVPNVPPMMKEKPQGSLRTALNPPPGFANPLKKVIYGLQGANPPPGFNRS